MQIIIRFFVCLDDFLTISSSSSNITPGGVSRRKMDALQLSWLKHAIIIFFTTFLHEDVAILAAAYSRVEDNMPLLFAYLSVYLGIICGDIFIYGLGHVAQNNRWLREKIIGPKVERIKLWLETHLVRVLIICRFTPGLLFPTFVACGWFRISFKRFAFVSILAGAIYSSVMLTLAVVFGDVLHRQFGIWIWVVLIVLVAAYALRNSFKPRWSDTTEGAMGELPLSFRKILYKDFSTSFFRHRGMPSLEGIRRIVSFAERIPNSLFYIPVGLRWLLLAVRYRSLTLPTVSNPLIETGGMWGESKSSIMMSVDESQRKWIADFVTLHRDGADAATDTETAKELLDTRGIRFPVVVKPDIGWQGYGVRLVEDDNHLRQYLSSFPHNEKLLLQRPVLYDGEAGIFYYRIPGEEKGHILSITLRYFPFVVGDGKSTVRELIQANPRSKLKEGYYLGKNTSHLGFDKQFLDHVPEEKEMVRLSFIGSIRVGGLYRNASDLITPELTSRFDEIARSIPEFYYGRFDVRFESTDLLKKGEGFSIIEINGAGSEAIHAWDPEVPIIRLYRELFKTQSLLFKIADKNRARGYKPESLVKFLRAAIHQNKLINHYPAAG
jgi:membrane protein DedA with SNARE-associated domain